MAKDSQQNNKVTEPPEPDPDKLFNGELHRDDVVQSIILLFIFTVVLIGVMLLCLVMDKGGEIGQFLADNANGLIITCVSMVLISIISYLYFMFEDRQVILHKSKLLEIYLLIAIAFLLDFIIGRYVSLWARPIAFFALTIGMFKKNKDAIFLNTMYAVILFVFACFLNNSTIAVYGETQVESFAEFLCVFCAGMLGIFIIKRMKTRAMSVLTAFILLVPVLVINLIMDLPSGDVTTVTATIDVIIFSALGCILSVLLYMFIEPIFEKAFSEITSFRLRELTSENAKLIKRLKKEAPGTYNHSVVVAQLSAACASAIGEDPELTRAVAYYHDMGKLSNPSMFAENETGNSMHDRLQYTPEISAEIIRSHTTKGAEFIKENHLPPFFSDIAIQHHGTLPIKFFYARALCYSDGNVAIKDYSYEGPTPRSKIAAIIMVADAAEAATRSLRNRSPENVTALVKSLVEERLNLDQFVHCDITLNELSIITLTIVKELTGVYHTRVEYPKLNVQKKDKK